MSDADGAPGDVGRVATQSFGTIVVVGGGCYGSYYVRQLTRARRARALTWTRLLVVDRDPDCRVAAEPRNAGEAEELGLRVCPSEWKAFFCDYFARAEADRDGCRRDAIVPSPLMPHLMFEWLLERARARWPDRAVEARPLARAPEVPWQRAAPGGTHYVSFAQWTCPINCVEPRLCPHTRGPRSWSLPQAARAYVQEERARGQRLAGPVIFHCVHRAYGVGMFDTRDVIAASDFVLSSAEDSSADILVGTVSHCHGALDRLVIAAPIAGSTTVPR